MKGKSLSKTLIVLGFSAAMLLPSIQRQANASVPKESLAANNEAKPLNELPPFLEPQLPSLDQPSIYLPQEEPSPASTTQETRLVIKLRDRRVYVYRNDRLQTSYPIAIGRAGWETPTGKFAVIDMQRDPTWQNPLNGTIIGPGADNPLGARWIGFWTDGRNFIGFHGTPNEKLVGQAVSHGCIRMKNQDVLALYAMVNIGTQVVVEP